VFDILASDPHLIMYATQKGSSGRIDVDNEIPF
jgi:hypothetical protein